MTTPDQIDRAALEGVLALLRLPRRWRHDSDHYPELERFHKEAGDRLEAILRAPPAEGLVACCGIPAPGCDYLAACNTPCNKCGNVHDPRRVVAHPPAPRGVTENEQTLNAMRTAYGIADMRRIQAGCGENCAHPEHDQMRAALTAALGGESEKQATAAVPVEKLRLLQVTWRRANGDYPESQQDCADDLQRLIDEAEGK